MSEGARITSERGRGISVSTEAEQILGAWRESAKYWTKHRRIVRAMFAPITAAMIEDAGIGAGQTILDVAGGTGEPSLTLSEIVGAGGWVTYTDAIPEMVEAARTESERKELSNLSFHQCLADSLPFDAASFDVVTCRLGVMLFPQPSTAVREMLRVTKPGGRIVLAVWHTTEANPFFSSITDVIGRYVESPPTEPEAPGAFRFAEHGLLARLVEEAGVAEVGNRVFNFKLEAPLSIDEFWPLRVELSDTLREKTAMLSRTQLAGVVEDVRAMVREFFSESGMSFPASTIIVTGRKPVSRTQVYGNSLSGSVRKTHV